MSSSQPVFFASAFEALYIRALGEQLTPKLKDELRKVGLDVEKPLQPAYPFEVWYQSLLLTATSLHPGVSREEAVERIGVTFLEGFQRTLIGAAVLQFARVIGVERSLVRMDRNTRTSSNVFVSKVERVGPKHMKLSSQLDPEFLGKFPPGEVALAHFQTGLVRALFKTLDAGVPVIRTTMLDATRRHSELDVQW